MANGKNLASGVGLQFSPTILGAIEQVCELWRSDVGRRDFLSGSSVASSALVEPSRDWLISVAGLPGRPLGGAARRAVRRGGGARDDPGAHRPRPPVRQRACAPGRRALPQQRRLRAARRLVPGGGGRELFSAVARLTELAGYMAIDTGQPGLAQRYYIQALRLAQAAGDRGYGGYVLAASMSHLAAQLGNPREIAQLARAAQEGARGRVTPRAEAMFHAAEARGHALMGDARAAQLAAGRRVTRWRRPTRSPATTRRGSRTSTRPTSPTSSPTATGTSARPRQRRGGPRSPSPGTRRRRARRRAIGYLLLATAQVQQREIEEACHTGTKAVELLETVRSNRGAEYLDDFQQRLEPYRDESVVREFGARLELQQAAA